MPEANAIARRNDIVASMLPAGLAVPKFMTAAEVDAMIRYHDTTGCDWETARDKIIRTSPETRDAT